MLLTEILLITTRTKPFLLLLLLFASVANVISVTECFFVSGQRWLIVCRMWNFWQSSMECGWLLRYAPQSYSIPLFFVPCHHVQHRLTFSFVPCHHVQHRLMFSFVPCHHVQHRLTFSFVSCHHVQHRLTFSFAFLSLSVTCIHWFDHYCHAGLFLCPLESDM